MGARAQLLLHGWAVDRNATIEEALKIADEAIGRNPGNGGIYSNRAMIYLATREFDLAGRPL